MNKGRILPPALFIFSTALLIISCGGGGTSSASSTSVTSPKAALSLGAIAFGNETVGAASTGQTVTLADPGNDALSITSISIAGTNAGDFSQTNTCGTSLAAGKNCSISITFKPSATGTRTATLAVADDASGSPQSVTLTGTGVAPPPAATLAPGSVDFGNETVGVTSAGQTVTLTDSGQGTLDISGISITGTNAGDFSQSNVCGTSLAAGKSCNIAVMFTPAASGTRTASLSITDNAAGSPQLVGLTGTGVIPILSVSPTSATVLLGGTQTFALNAPATCTSTLFGNVPVSGSGATYAAAYTVPQVVPSAWTDTVSCTETADPTQTVPARITLHYPVPTITSTSASYASLGTIFLFGPAITSFLANGTGFLSDTILTPMNDTNDICGSTTNSWNQLQISFDVGYSDFGPRCSPNIVSDWDPGYDKFTASDPATGHGGGTSNVGQVGFLGDQNQIAIGKVDAFYFDPATGTVYKKKLADGTSDGSFVVTYGTVLAIGTDNTVTPDGIVVVFTGTSAQAFDQLTNAQLWNIPATSPGSLHGGAVGDGWAVLTANGTLDTFDAIDLQTGTVSHISVANTPQNAPWDYQIISLNGNPTAVVWSVNTGVLSEIEIPSFNLVNSITLPNIFNFTDLNNPSPTKFPDGWQLQVFNSGPSAGTAVLLSQYDQVLVYVNLNTMTEIRRVDLTAPFKNANPPLPELQSFRIGKDEADGSIVVAFADPVNGKTVLYNVDANGNMTRLNATAPFLATGLQESSDGTQIYWGNRSTFAITPKQ